MVSCSIRTGNLCLRESSAVQEPTEVSRIQVSACLVYMSTRMYTYPLIKPNRLIDRPRVFIDSARAR